MAEHGNCATQQSHDVALSAPIPGRPSNSSEQDCFLRRVFVWCIRGFFFLVFEGVHVIDPWDNWNSAVFIFMNDMCAVSHS